MKRKKRIEENAEQIRERIAKKIMQEAGEYQRDKFKKDGAKQVKDMRKRMQG